MPAFAFQGLGLPFVVLSALVIVIGLLYYGYRQRRFYRNLPGPPHSWLFGHIKVISEIAALMPPNCHPQLYYTEITRRHNIDGIFYLDLWPIGPGTVIITDPKLIEQAPLPRPLPVHPMAGVFMKPMWGEGTIAATSGPLWKKLHTAMSPAFSWTHVRGLTGLMIDESILFKRKLDELSFTGEIFSMEELVAKFIFGIVSMVTLGIPLHAQTAGSQDLDDLRELVNLAREESDVRVAYNPIVQIPRRWRRRQVLNRLEPSLLNKIYDRLEWLLREGVVPSRKNPTSILDLLLREYVKVFTEKQGRVQYGHLRLSGTDECVLLSK
ncbi:hypothetical protein ACHAPJ_008436 [Fusarium lateritium]